MRARLATAIRPLTVAILVLGVVLWAAGAFRGGRVAPGRRADPPGLTAPARRAVALRSQIAVFEEAVGTVASRRRVSVAAQVTARVVSVAARVGDAVTRGSPLVVLDDSDFVARFNRGRSQYERVKGLLARQAATHEQMEAAEAEYLQAKAAVDHTRIAAPIDGVVAERAVEPGDLASPGRTLLVVLDRAALRVEAQVREGLIDAVRLGETLGIAFPGNRPPTEGRIAEILPSADPRSRTFEVRIDFDPVPGIHPGMFARVRIPVGERTVVSTPTGAIVRVGQLETVLVEENGRWSRRLVTTGAMLPDGTVEVLSGLAGGETVGIAGEATS